MRFGTPVRITLLFAMAILGALIPARIESSQDVPMVAEIPSGATALIGTPSVVVSSGSEHAERKLLTDKDAQKERLLISIVDGKFYWASRGNRELEINQSGAFTYFTGPPGAYIKLTKIGGKIVYFEHVHIFLETITYWGELEIVTGR